MQEGKEVILKKNWQDDDKIVKIVVMVDVHGSHSFVSPSFPLSPTVHPSTCRLPLCKTRYKVTERKSRVFSLSVLFLRPCKVGSLRALLLYDFCQPHIFYALILLHFLIYSLGYFLSLTPECKLHADRTLPSSRLLFLVPRTMSNTKYPV